MLSYIPLNLRNWLVVTRRKIKSSQERRNYKVWGVVEMRIIYIIFKCAQQRPFVNLQNYYIITPPLFLIAAYCLSTIFSPLAGYLRISVEVGGVFYLEHLEVTYSLTSGIV